MFRHNRSSAGVPRVIPIARIPGYRTEFAGTWSRGQFLGKVLSQTDHFVWADGDRVNSRRWYAYLHEFDREGNYLESTVESPGIGEEGRQAAMLLLEDWLAGIPGLAYGNIAIRPFRFEHDAITFGLIIEDGHGTDWAELYPDRLGFHAPWNGSCARPLPSRGLRGTGFPLMIQSSRGAARVRCR